jgi:hypothetical protein
VKKQRLPLIRQALNSQSEFSIAVQEDGFSFVDSSVDNEAVEVELNTANGLTVQCLKNGTTFANGNITLTTSRGIVAIANASSIVKVKWHFRFNIIMLVLLQLLQQYYMQRAMK